MGKLRRLMGTAVLAAAAVAFPGKADAQTVIIDESSVLDALNDIVFDSGDYYENRNFGSQFQFLFGPGIPGRASFPELELARDAEATELAYGELLFLQTQVDPTLRVPDLRNPYSTSVQLLPLSQFNSRVVGSEFNFEPLPNR